MTLPRGNQIEISDGVYSKVPEGWAVATSGDAGEIALELVPEGYESAEVESYGTSDSTSSAPAILLVSESSCKQPEEGLSDNSSEWPDTSGFNETIVNSGVFADGTGVVAGHPATWTVSYTSMALPWFYDMTFTSASDYPNYLTNIILDVCVDELDLSSSIFLSDSLAEPYVENPDDEPTSNLNAFVPGAREDVHSFANASYRGNVDGLIELLEQIDSGGLLSRLDRGKTDVSDIPRDLVSLDYVVGDPFSGEIGDTVETEEDGNTSEDSGMAEVEAFIFDYFEAVERGDWSTTYSLLADVSKEQFTEEEWIETQETGQETEGLLPPLASMETEVTEEFVVGADLTFEDGSTGAMSVLVVPSTGEKGRLLTEEDISYLKSLS